MPATGDIFAAEPESSLVMPAFIERPVDIPAKIGTNLVGLALENDFTNGFQIQKIFTGVLNHDNGGMDLRITFDLSGFKAQNRSTRL